MTWTHGVPFGETVLFTTTDVDDIDATQTDWVDVCDEYGVIISSTIDEPPEPKTYVVSVPGGIDVDLSETLTGYVAFSNRTLTLSFHVFAASHSAFERRMVTVRNKLHGVRMKLQLSWDTYVDTDNSKLYRYTYRGRATVANIERTRQGGTFDLVLDAEPYKYRNSVYYSMTPESTGKTYLFESGRMPVRPTIQCSSPVVVAWDDETYTVTEGTHVLTDVIFHEGDNVLGLAMASSAGNRDTVYLAYDWGDL